MRVLLGLPNSAVSLGGKETITALTPDALLQQSRLWPPAHSPQPATQYPARMQSIFLLACLHWIYLYGYLLSISSSTRSPHMIAPFKINVFKLKRELIFKKVNNNSTGRMKIQQKLWRACVMTEVWEILETSSTYSCGHPAGGKGGCQHFLFWERPLVPSLWQQAYMWQAYLPLPSAFQYF